MVVAPTRPLPVESAPATGPVPEPQGENLYLLGRPTLRRFIRYVRGHVDHPPGRGALSAQWHAARDVVRRVERDEAGAANDPPMHKLGPEYEPLLIELLKDPLIRYGYNTVPTDIVLVELDRLVVYQKHVDLVYARQLERRLGARPDREQIFRTCLPHDHPQPPVKWARRRGRGGFVFVSPSNDLRFLGAMSLEAGNIVRHPPPGTLVGVVGLAVGFGGNFVNAVYAERRLILNNGTHRAYALRRLGVTHVPCIVQHIASRDELDVVATAAIRRDAGFFLEHPRPSMLKDYLNPQLFTVLPVRRRLRQVTVRFEVEETSIPAL